MDDLNQDNFTPAQQEDYAYNVSPNDKAPEPKKTNRGLKTFLIILVSVIVVSCVAIIAGGITYTLFGTKGEGIKSIFGNPGVSQNKGADKKLEQSATPDFKPSQSGEPLSVREIAAKVKPSVVGVVTTQEGGSGGGSGIVMRADGYIITNAHVIENAETIKVVLDDENKTQYDAAVVGADTQSDIAVIKAQNASGLVPAEFGDSDKLAEGDLAVAVGNPRGLELQGTVTVGYISAINRNLELENGRAMTLIQTDAAINPGNSGGALVNEYGQVVGINSRKFNTMFYEGLGFAIPINLAKPIVDDLLNKGYVSGRPRIGIAGQDIEYDSAKQYGLPMGVYVIEVAADTDAAKKDIKKGDVIVAINDKQINSMAQLNSEKDKFKVGDTVKLTLVREGKRFDVEIILGEMNKQ